MERPSGSSATRGWMIWSRSRASPTPSSARLRRSAFLVRRSPRIDCSSSCDGGKSVPGRALRSAIASSPAIIHTLSKMPERPGPIFEATIDAFLRGVEFAGEGTVELVGEALGLTVGKRRALVAFGRLDGLREAPGVLELFADTGDTIALYATAGLD